MDEWLRGHLVCPRDFGRLELKAGRLICEKGCTYAVIDGVPIMLLEEAMPTHRACCSTLEQLSCGESPQGAALGKTEGQYHVDPFVQQEIIGTCGLMYKQLVNKLDRYPIPELPLPQGEGRMFLDLGCNWGRWCVAAARKGYCPVGIDPSWEAIMAAQRTARQLGVEAAYIVADARYLPFAQAAFDVVFSYSVLQHFDEKDVRKALDNISRTLKAGGISLIQMPNILGVRNLYNQVRGPLKKGAAFRVRYWTLPKLKKTFANAIGPTSLSVDGYFSLNTQLTDVELLPLRFRAVVLSSYLLRKASEKIRLLKICADSIYVRSIKPAEGDPSGGASGGYFLKRPLDFILALTGLFFSLPLWIILCLAIWLEDFGPVFFEQERVGLNGRIFLNMKFRSMIRDAEKDTGPLQAKENDPRVTRIGTLLRRTAMDELPQLLNILKGEMSFVGPRPLRPLEIELEGGDCEKISDLQLSDSRSRVKPGLTGVAQVYASRCLTRKEKFKYDLWYIDKASLALDLKLILLSFWISLNRKWDTMNKGLERPV